MEKEYPPEVGKKKKKKPLFAICATFVRNFNAFYAPLPLPAPPLSRRNTQTHAGRDCGVLNGPLTPRSRSTETSATIFPLRRETRCPIKIPLPDIHPLWAEQPMLLSPPLVFSAAPPLPLGWPRWMGASKSGSGIRGLSLALLLFHARSLNRFSKERTSFYSAWDFVILSTSKSIGS